MDRVFNIFGIVLGVFVILTAIGLMLLNFFGGLLILGAGLLAFPKIRHKLNIAGKKAFGVGIALYFVGFITVAVFADVDSNPQSETALQATSAPIATNNASATIPKAEQVQNAQQVSVVALPQTQDATAEINKYDVSCKIVGVSDGDTATCLTDNKKQIKIRFDQIDAPEAGQDFGSASKKALSDMIFGKTVGLDTKEQDKYGRTVAEVFIDDKNINKEMVALGMAWAYREYVKDNEYIELETNARRNSLGLWSQPNAIYPSDFRRAKRGEQSTPIQTQQIAQIQEQRDLADSGGQCGSKRTCKQMSSCKEARHYLNVCGVSRLDKDGDGVPCESLCR